MKVPFIPLIIALSSVAAVAVDTDGSAQTRDLGNFPNEFQERDSIGDFSELAERSKHCLITLHHKNDCSDSPKEKIHWKYDEHSETKCIHTYNKFAFKVHKNCPVNVNALIYRDHHCPVGGGKGVMPGHGCYSVNTGHPWLSLKVLNVSQPN